MRAAFKKGKITFEIHVIGSCKKLNKWFSLIDCKRNERGDSNHTIYSECPNMTRGSICNLQAAFTLSDGFSSNNDRLLLSFTILQVVVNCFTKKKRLAIQVQVKAAEILDIIIIAFLENVLIYMSVLLGINI